MTETELQSKISNCRQACNELLNEAGECLVQRLFAIYELTDGFWSQVNGANLYKLFDADFQSELLDCVKLTGDVPSETGEARRLALALRTKSVNFRDEYPDFFDAIAHVKIFQRFSFDHSKYLTIFLGD